LQVGARVWADFSFEQGEVETDVGWLLHDPCQRVSKRQLPGPLGIEGNLG
jgi:hypothetical protein